jgi:RecA/RadA recombinase
VSANLYEKLLSIVGMDVVEIFGPSGSGKSTFAYMVVLDALKLGKKVFFLDAERNLNLDKIPEGLDYRYTPDYNMILNIARNLPPADLYVLDSLGMSVLPMYAEAPMDRRGLMLLKAISLMEYFKLATYRNKALAIITNQPISSFGKQTPEDELRPWGDKAIYMTKEVWRTFLMGSKENETTCEIRSWRSRRFGRGKLLFKLMITDRGVSVEPQV